MSEHQADQTGVESGSLSAQPVIADAGAPMIAPDQEETAPKADAPKVEAVKAEAPKIEAPKIEAPKVEGPKIEASKAEAPRSPGKVMIMSPGDRAWAGTGAAAPAAAESGMFGKRGAMAAVVALALVAGALGGALATTGLRPTAVAESAPANGALEASVARIDAEMAALRTSVEHTNKMGMSQFNKTTERLDKVEKAQIEPVARLAKLTETVDKLRATPPAAAAVPVAAAAPVAAKEVTGSVTPPTVAAATPPKPEVGRLPTVEGWVLRDVDHGSALIESRRGVFEVYAGDPVPGLGRVEAVRRQDGRWVVVTSKGLIVER